jgi:hypothetical protein
MSALIIPLVAIGLFLGLENGFGGGGIAELDAREPIRISPMHPHLPVALGAQNRGGHLTFKREATDEFLSAREPMMVSKGGLGYPRDLRARRFMRPAAHPALLHTFRM